VLEHEILPQLEPDDFRFRVLVEGGHGCSLRRGRDAAKTIEYNRKFLILVKVADGPTIYI